MKKALALLVALLVMMLAACGTGSSGTSSPAGSAPSAGTSSAPASGSEDIVAAGGFVLPSGDYTLPTNGIGMGISSQVKANEPYKIVCIVKNSTNPYMISQLAGVEKAGADAGFEAIVKAPAQQDSVEEQVSLIETMIQDGVDAIIIHCADSNGIMPGFRKAQAAGIPIITIGTPGSEPTMLRTGVNYEETGYEVAKYLIEKNGGKGQMIILEGPPGAQNAQERLAGIQRAVAEYPDVEIVASQTANFKRTEGMSVTENLLQKYPDVDIIIGANDESALGAVQALSAAGKTDVLVGGFDGSKDAASSIQSGGLTVTFNTDPYGSGYLAAMYAVQYLNDGTEPPANFVPFPSANDDPLITADNVDEYVEKTAWWTAG